MALYAKMRETWKNKDVKGHRECFHDDWRFVFHSSGKVMTRADDLPDDEFKEFMEVLVQENHRCIYENDDILVTHSFNTYKSGDKEALLMVSLKKDGLLWRSETGATEIKTTN
jgi:ketosteroid isomerase-like protein